jgi:hypothetical protein
MASFTYQPIVVTGIRADEADPDEPIAAAHRTAIEMFGAAAVSPLGPLGDNFHQSFCVFPSGSGNDRPAQAAHRNAVEAFATWLGGSGLEFAAIRWGDDRDGVEVTHSDVDGPATAPGRPNSP